MGRKKTNLHQKIAELLDHTEEPPAESASPLRHFERTVNDTLTALRYIDDHVNTGSIYLAVFEGHMSLIRRMALGSLIQAFERFIKETAVICVDHVSGHVHDDRFDEFKPAGSSIALNFHTAGSVGRLLCESDTWMNIESTNKRFRKALRPPDKEAWDGYLFLGENQTEGSNKGLDAAAKKAKEDAEEDRRAGTDTTEVLWQVRHTISHNVGLLTRSDAKKLRMILKKAVSHDRVIAPTQDDLRYVKQMLHNIATSINKRVATRLAELLTEIHKLDSGLFNAQEVADKVSKQFGFGLTVDNAVGTP